MLEQLSHGDSCFATFTYADVPAGHHGPPRFNVWSLVPRDLTLFLKRLRKARGPFRYYAVGEYGTRYGRAHFHAALFGVSVLEWDIVQRAWDHGRIHLGDLTRQSAGYIAGYVTKKLTKEGAEGLFGRHPEFARWSTGRGNGGLGAAAADELASRLVTVGDYGQVDVPGEVRMDGRKFPLGRYLRQRVRVKMGFPVQAPPDAKLLMAVKRKEETKDVAAIAAREARRVNQAASAEARVKILRSKEVL